MAAPKQLRDRLAGYLYEQEPSDTGDYKAWCPLHDDHNPSASINFDKAVWACFRCNTGGTLRDLVEQLDAEAFALQEAGLTVKGDTSTNVRSLAAHRAKTRGDAQPEPLVEAAVAGFHSALMSNAARLEALRARRGLTNDTIVTYDLGWDDAAKAYTIPIRDADGELVNIRRYRMDPAPKQLKIWNVKGHGTMRLYPLDVLDDSDTIIICEGELDALLNNQMGFPTVTTTAGAGKWNPGWNPLFTDKHVHIVFDRDQTGVDGGHKLATLLSGVAKSVHVVELPLPFRDSGGLDITDFYVTEGRTSEDFAALLDAPPPEDDRGDVLDVGVLASFASDLVGRTLGMTVTITGRTFPNHTIAKHVAYECTMDAGPKCKICPMLTMDGEMKARIEPSDPVVLKLLDANTSQTNDTLREHKGIQKCNRLKINVTEHQSVESLYARASVEHIDDESEGDFTTRRIISVGRHDTLSNQTVRVIGTTLPNPKTAENEFQAWEVEKTETSIDTFHMTPELKQRLSIFQPKPKQSSFSKLQEIARDLEANVTRIYGRTAMHMAMDLVFHSVLSFNFGGQKVDKGWLELLVVGDTRTGKSEAATRLSHHYRLGRVVSCESASFAGIIGGLQQPDRKHWVVTWGAIPLNDRRLITLDEVSGLTYEQIGQMSSVRSSGVAQITKINSEATSARTRLIWLGNPRDGRRMESYQYGVEAVQPLIGNMEDIARFDLAMSVAADEVPSDVINTAIREAVPHRYNSDDCHQLMLWAWSRRATDVVWVKGAEDAVYAAAKELGETYIETPPLIQAANARMKVARLAVALAARTFSTDSTGEKVVVRIEHVKSALKLINVIYGNISFGYLEVSKQHKERVAAAQDRREQTMQYLWGRMPLVRFLRATKGTFRRQNMEELMNITREEANAYIQSLFDAGALDLDGVEVKATPLLNQLLREIDTWTPPAKR